MTSQHFGVKGQIIIQRSSIIDCFRHGVRRAMNTMGVENVIRGFSLFILHAENIMSVQCNYDDGNDY